MICYMHRAQEEPFFKQETYTKKKCLVNSLGPEALVAKHMVRITSQSKAEQLTVAALPEDFVTLLYNIHFL